MLSVFVAWSFLSERPLVDGRFSTLSAVAELRLQRRIDRAVKDGKPCVALVTAGDRERAKSLLAVREGQFVRACADRSGDDTPPVVVWLSEKNGPWVDAPPGVVLPYEEGRRGHEAARHQLGLQMYEAAAWRILDGIYGEERPIPWWMAARGRPLRTAVRASEMGLIGVAGVLGLISFFMSLLGLRYNGRASFPTSRVPTVGATAPATRVVIDDGGDD